MYRLSWWAILALCLVSRPCLAVAEACTITGTEHPCRALVAGLPFPVTLIAPGQEEKQRIFFISSRKNGKTEVAVKISLQVESHVTTEARDNSFAALRSKADPDMGLSYGWDFITTRGFFLYHLHADCTLAETHFLALTETLTNLLGPPEDSPSPTLNCRCGAGCRETPQP